MCFCVSYLFFFGVELKALVQGAAVLLNMVLLSTNTFRVLHHLLLDVTKQAAHRHAVTPGHWTVLLVLLAWRALKPSANRMYFHMSSKGSKKLHYQSLNRCSHSTMSFTCGGPPEPHSFRALRRSRPSQRDCVKRASNSLTHSITRTHAHTQAHTHRFYKILNTYILSKSYKATAWPWFNNIWF